MRRRHLWSVTGLALVACLTVGLAAGTTLAKPKPVKCKPPVTCKPTSALTYVTHDTMKGKSAYFVQGNAPISGLMYCDGHVAKGARFLSMWWVMPKKMKNKIWVSEPSHQHMYGETVYFTAQGSGEPNSAEDRSLGGTVEVWIEGECHSMTTTFQAFIPPDTSHKYVFKNLTKPILEVRYLGDSTYRAIETRMPIDDNGVDDYGWMIYDVLGDMNGTTRCNWMNPGDILKRTPIPVPNMMYAGMPYALSSGELPHVADQHADDPYPHDYVVGFRAPHRHTIGNEYFIFIGLNPDKPSDLGAEVLFYSDQGPPPDKTNGVTKTFDKTSFVYVPAGVWHCPIDYLTVTERSMFMTWGSAPQLNWGQQNWPAAP